MSDPVTVVSPLPTAVDLGPGTVGIVATPVKPGYKTTEFWLSLAAMLLSAAFASGALTNSTAVMIAGFAATILTALGYSVSRAMVKSA